MDRIPLRVANLQRYHRGALGEVLERYLRGTQRCRKGDYSMFTLEQLLAEAQRHDPAIGLNLFAHFSAQDRHMLAHACKYCANVDEALRFWARYARLASDMDNVRYVEEQSGAALEVWVEAPETLARFTVEHYFTMCITLANETNSGQLRPIRIDFAHARPSYHEHYGRIFGESVRFGCPSNLLVYASEDLKVPLQTRHAGMFEVICQELDRCLARQHQLSGWAGKAAQSMRRTLSEGRVPGLEEQASALHLSSRTLRRRLEQQGLSFRQLLDLVRLELEQQLQLQGVAPAEIATRLGYSDLDAYQHARRRWRGDEPQT